MARMSRAIVGGAVETALLTSMMYFVASMMTGHAMDIAAMLGSVMGSSWALGMMAHLANGVVVFPLMYSAGANSGRDVRRPLETEQKRTAFAGRTV